MKRMTGQIWQNLGPRPWHGWCDTARLEDPWAVVLGRGQRRPRHEGECETHGSPCDGASLLDLLRLADARPRRRH